MITPLHYQARINTKLLQYLPLKDTSPQRLHEAMHYAVFNGGKRLRPLLVYATGEALNVDIDKLDAAACAIEFIHAYSLVHDDLPSMDNDDWRRGKPACHKAFDEATAILVGDALQSLAFECLANASETDRKKLKMIQTLAVAAGSSGMAGGQALDLATQIADHILSASDRKLIYEATLQEIETTHRLKTGALIHASVMMGAITADATPEVTQALSCYAYGIAIAFQIQDDIRDIEGNMTTLGKQPGSDSKLNKPTYPVVTGLAQAKEKVSALQKQAIAALEILPNAHLLRELTKKILK